MSDPARSRFGHDVLRTFDAWQDARDFLADVIESSQASSETEQLFQQSLVACSQDWQYLVDCAESIRRLRGHDQQSLDGQDVASYIWRIWNGLEARPPTSEPWEATDRLIARAKELARDPEIRPPSSAGLFNTQRQRRRDSEVGFPCSQPPESAKRRLTTSHYWSDQPQDQRPQESYGWSIQTQWPLNVSQECVPVASQVAGLENIGYVSTQLFPQYQANSPNQLVQVQRPDQTTALENWTGSEDQSLGVKHVSSTSPYFAPPVSSQENKPLAKKRPPRGTISAVPFAPLTAHTFGLIQEVFAHEPFWLLIAVTFLIRTKGLHAIPVFYKFKERFPTPTAVMDPANTEELVSMIRHLGLSVHRVALMQKYAQGFLHNPPRAGKTYKVKNYDKRDFDPSARVVQELCSNPSSPSEDDDSDLEAWEIGHLTKGKYALDSWRIFCRDELLGRATDWNGGGREAEFQPEWMRVRPADKELRAYLRWMWMKEGWEWDPVSGERTVLREEMQRAVNEGRVEYDDTGGLRIMDEPRMG